MCLTSKVRRGAQGGTAHPQKYDCLRQFLQYDASWSIMSDGVLLVAHLLKYVTEVFLVSISTSLYFQYSYYPCTPYHLIYSNLADFKI